MIQRPINIKSDVEPCTNSSSSAVLFREKLRYYTALGAIHFRSLLHKPDFSDVLEEAATYDALMRRYVGRGLAGAKALEIGFGQRPFRLFWLAAMGCNVKGIDMDVPVLQGRAHEFFNTLRCNGPERAIKTFLRFFLADWHQWRAFKKIAKNHTGQPFIMPVERLLVGNAADISLWDRLEGGHELIYSEDVFEHITEPDLISIIQHMASHMTDNGVAIICPMIFTGIAGGHLIEWYPEVIDRNIKRRSGPWEHLRQNRFPADTFLNQLPRAAYREIFSRSFDIIEETELMPNLGRRFLTSEVRGDLAGFTDEELFSNKVMFVLRKRKH